MIIIISITKTHVDLLQMASHGGSSSHTLWLENISSRCLRRTLKILVVRGFCNSWNEFYLLNYLVLPEHGFALERVELYLPPLQEMPRQWAYHGAAMLQKTSNRVQVILHSAWKVPFHDFSIMGFSPFVDVFKFDLSTIRLVLLVPWIVIYE